MIYSIPTNIFEYVGIPVRERKCGLTQSENEMCYCFKPMPSIDIILASMWVHHLIRCLIFGGTALLGLSSLSRLGAFSEVDPSLCVTDVRFNRCQPFLFVLQPP